ncbi:MAG: hypothetical protein FK734_14865 [Asgard group archaeon]|nr:hypothetical protein [Asgard group archaeon]
MGKRSSLYKVGEILAIIAGVLGIIFSVLGFISSIDIGGGWIFLGGFGEQAFWIFVALGCSIVVLLIGIGSIFTDIKILVLGILVIIFSIFIPGIACIIGIIAGILFIIEGV